MLGGFRLFFQWKSWISEHPNVYINIIIKMEVGGDLPACIQPCHVAPQHPRDESDWCPSNDGEICFGADWQEEVGKNLVKLSFVILFLVNIAKVSSPVSIHNWLDLFSLSVCLFVCLVVTNHDDISFYSIISTLDHTNHIFSESLSSGDDNDRDADLQKRQIQRQRHGGH